MKLPKPKNIPLSTVAEMARRNPNVLGPERYQELKKGIDKHGFLQPILVYEQDGGYVIVDGVHRVKAMDELGADKITAVIADSPEHAVELRLLLNKVRGELDQTVVGDDLLYLTETQDVSDLVTGFTESETNVLVELASYEGDEDDLLSGASVAVEEEIKPKTYSLTLKFDSEVERALVKEWLESRGDSPEDALLNYAGGGR